MGSKQKEEPRQKSKAKRRRRKGLRYLGLAALCLSLIGAGSGFLAVNSAEASLKKELEADKAVGLILDPNEIKEITQVPADQNGARAYAGALSMLKAAKAQIKLAHPKNNPVQQPVLSLKIIQGTASASDIALAREVLGYQKDALNAYRDASTFPHVFFDRDYSLVAFTLMPEFSYMREGAQQLMLEGALAVHDNNWELARQDLLAAGRISAHVGEDLPFIAGLVQTSIQTGIYRTANAILATRWQDPRAVNLVGDILNQLGDPTSFSKMLKLESLFATQIPATAELALAKDPRVWSDNGGMGMALRMLAVPGVGVSVQKMILTTQRHQMEAALRWGDNYPELEKALKKIELDQQNSGLVGQFAGTFSAVFQGGPTSLAELAAQRRLIAQGLAAIRVHAGTGQWPIKLPLSGKYSVDPHSNHPLKFLSTTDGFQAWSVGKNGVDDGGKRADIQQGGSDDAKPDDVSIRLGDPFQPPQKSLH